MPINTQLFRNGAYLQSSATLMLFFASWGIWWSFFQIWLTDDDTGLGLNGSQVGTLYSANSMATLVVMFLYGTIQDRLALKRHLIPDMLENACSLALVIAVFAGANLLHHEAGLLAATVMGIVLANQKSVTVHHIIHFKENLRVLLLAVLFVVLAARVDLDTLLLALNWRVLGFVAALILVVRPAMVWISTAGSSLGFNEKLFLAWMAPRGIVAAAVASEFSLRLVEDGMPEEEARRRARALLCAVEGALVLARPAGDAGPLRDVASIVPALLGR